MNLIDRALEYLQSDWRSNPYRLVLEMFNWFLNIFSGLFVAFTVPNTPFMYLYPMWFLSLSISIYSAISRGSAGWLLTSVSLFTINLVGYIRLLTN